MSRNRVAALHDESDSLVIALDEPEVFLPPKKTFPTKTKVNERKVVEKEVPQSHFPSLLTLNAESLNVDKMGELEGCVQVTGADIITVTEEHKQSSEHLTIQGYKQFIKLRHQNHLLGKKGGDVACFVREQFAPQLLLIPHIDDDNEMIWIMIQPKKLPRSVTGIVIGVFYCSPSMASFQKKVFAEKLYLCVDFITSKY